MSDIVDPLVPDAVKIAAKRGFVRTWYQTATGLIPAAAGSVFTFTLPQDFSSGWVIAAVISVLTIVAAPFIAGFRSYASIMANGIPEAYKDAAVTELVEDAVDAELEYNGSEGDGSGEDESTQDV